MAIKFLSGLNLSDVTAGSILKLDSNGNIVAATAGTDYVASSLWTATSSDIYRNSSVRIGTYQQAISPDAKLHVFDYQTTTPKILIEDGNTGDASMQFKISTQSYTMGIDNSDSDKFIIAASSALGTTNALEIGTGGKLTVPAAASNGAVRFEVGGYNRLRFNGGVDLLGYTSDHLWVIGNSGTSSINLGGDWDWDKQIAISYTPNTVGNYGGVLSIGQTEKNNANWTHGVTRFYTSGGEKMRIDSAGRVGIGTTAPVGRLTVSTSDQYALRVEQSGNTTGDFVDALSILSTTQDNSYKVAIGFSTTGTDGTHHRASIKAMKDSNGTYGGRLDFHTREVTTANHGVKMTIRSDGKVGVGITGPVSKLHVYGSSSGATAYQSGNDGLIVERGARAAINLLSPANSDSYVFFGNPTAGNAGYVGYENSTNRLVVKSSDYISLLDSTGEVVRIDGSNVGIGTTSPGTKLTVSGSAISISNGWTGTHDILFVGGSPSSTGSANQTAARIRSTASAPGGAATGDLLFTVNSGDTFVDALYIEETGNVGIGTTSPVQTLVVDKSNSGSGGGYIRVQNEIGGSGSNVGIDFATFSPQYYSESVTSTDPVARIKATDTGSYSGRLDIQVRGTGTGGTLSTIGTFDNNGRVGIGTTSPNGRVTVFDDMISSSSTTTDIAVSKTSYGSINFQGANQEAGASNTKQQAITWQVNDYGSSNVDYGVQAAIAVSNNGSVGTQMGFFTSNSYSAGPSERIRITAAGLVGISNSNPSRKLDVAGTFRATGVITASSDIVSDGGGILKFIAGSNHVSGLTVYNAAQNGYLSNRITTDSHSRGWGWEFTTNEANSSSGNVYFRVGYNGAVSYLNSGNFGIGTTNPGSLLSIRATTASHQLVRINRANSDTAALYLGNNSSNDAIISGNNAPISLGKDVSGTYTEYVNIATDGELKFSAYGAGILKTNASGIVSLDTNTYLTSVSVDWSDIGSINGTININSTTQIGQGDTETLVSFQNSGTERGRFEVDSATNSYFVATGFKTTGSSTGLLKSDGTIDTSTYATTADINSFIEITDVATYLSTNNYITSSYTGFDSRYYTETEANDRFVSFENYNRAVPAAGGWYKLVKLSRGAVRIGISYTGGNMSPHTYIVEAFKDWSSTATLNVQKYGEAAYISEFRIIQESGGGNGDYYLEAYFTSLTNTHSFECYFQEILGYRSVSEIFAVSSGNTLNATNSGTNTPIEALVVGSNEGLYTRNLDVNGRLYLDTLDTNTTSTSALVLGSSSEIEKRTLGSAAFSTSTDFVAVSGDTMTGTLKLDSELQFSRGGSGDYSNYIRATNYPSEGYTSASAKYWLEYGAKGGHHFVVNTDGGSGASENNYDDFTIWQGAVDGDRLFEVTNAGIVQIPNQLKIGGDTSSSSHYIYDAYHDASSAYFHAPKFLIRSDSSATGGIDEAPVALAMFNRNGTNNTWVKMAFASREVNGGGNTVSIAGIAAQKTTGTSGNWASGKLHLWTKNGATVVDNMVLQPNGNVGIGTSSPGYKLDVEGTIRSGTSYRASINGDSSGAVLMFGSAADIDSLGVVGAYASLFNISSGNGDISFQFNNTERMRLNSTGNLGIGTTSPGGRLELNGSGQSWSTAPAIRMWDSYNSKGWLVGSANNVTAGDFYIRTLPGEDTNPGTSNTEFTIKHATGYIGIGTTSPSYRVHAKTTGTSWGYRFENNTSDQDVHVFLAHGGGYGLAVDSTSNSSSTYLLSLKGGTGGAGLGSVEHFRVTSAGNVGIGTASPGFKLEVNGTTRLGDTATEYTRFGTYGALLSTDTHILHNMLWTGSWTQIDNTKSSSTIYMGSSSNNTIKFGYTGVGDTSWSYNHTFENDGDYTAAGVIKGYGSVRVDAAATGNPYFGLYQAGSEKAYVQYVDTGDNLVMQSDGQVTIRGDVQHGQGDENAVISFYQSTSNELGKFDQDGYLYATGFKTGGTTGFLKSDGSVDTNTYANSADVLALSGGTMTGDLTIPSKIIHSGDTNTFFQFNTDEILLATGGGSGFKVNNTEVFAYKDLTIAGGETLSLGQRAEADDNGRTVLIEGAANAANGEGSGRIFFSEHNSTTAAADSYGLSLYYEGDPNVALPSGFQPNTGNATWSLRRHDNSVNGTPIFFGSRTNSNVTFEGALSVPEYIYHRGDANTYIRLLTDRIQIVAGGTTKFDSNNAYLIGSTNISVKNITARDIVSESDRTYNLGIDSNRWAVVFCETLDSAGQHESKLQNPEGETPISEYETGTVLVWKGGKNLPCTTAADHMRMGIAVKGTNSPLVQGAEPVLCTGEVKEGDYLVTSTTEGHAEAISPEFMRQHMLFDCVIGKALEDGAGESHLVKTWINI